MNLRLLLILLGGYGVAVAAGYDPAAAAIGAVESQLLDQIGFGFVGQL